MHLTTRFEVKYLCAKLLAILLGWLSCHLCAMHLATRFEVQYLCAMFWPIYGGSFYATFVPCIWPFVFGV